MPDVNRSDSQRSDTSLKPRVSFNRDVHVKRIVTRNSPHAAAASTGDNSGRFVSLHVQKEHIGHRNQEELVQEAAKVLQQADQVECTTKKRNDLPDKFYTLPVRKRHQRRKLEPTHSSQEHIDFVRKSSETIPSPRKSPKTSLFNLMKKSEVENKPDKLNIVRSVSDASNLRRKNSHKQRKYSSSDSEEAYNNSKNKKSQLSPIIEVSTPREDYFSVKNDYFDNKENESNSKKNQDIENVEVTTRKKWKYLPNKNNARNAESLKTNNEITVNKNALPNVTPDIIVIDIDKAKDISKNNSTKKSHSQIFKNKLKSFTSKKENARTKKHATSLNCEATNQNKSDQNCNTTDYLSKPVESDSDKSLKVETLETDLKRNIDKLNMIHSSQRPVEKVPLTRGYKVDKMVKRLNKDKSPPPPPKTNILIAPTATVAHNHNQPFSYTQPKSNSPDILQIQRRSPGFNNIPNPVIYAQVVVGNGKSKHARSNKQTIHSAYSNNSRQLFHSDSDEGLGYEESSGFGKKSYTHFGDENYTSYEEHKGHKFKPVREFEFNDYPETNNDVFTDSSIRGRGDGRDTSRRDSLTEAGLETKSKQKISTNLNNKTNLSHRRDLLESRINSRLVGDKYTTMNKSSPEISPNQYNSSVNKYRYWRNTSSPIAFIDNNLETGIDNTREEKSNHFSETINNVSPYKDYDSDLKSFNITPDNNVSSSENIQEGKVYKELDHDNFRSLHFNKYKTKMDKSIIKNQNRYKSNPEIHFINTVPKNNYDNNYFVASDTYHDSLRRQRHQFENNLSKNTTEYFEDDLERKDKFGDSGIENDIKRDVGDMSRTKKQNSQLNRSNNDSEDEGFVSSLLIASERQHTEDNFAYIKKKYKKESDSDQDSSNFLRENADYKHNKKEYKPSKKDYVHRERSIDDGSHYDPRIDKDLNWNNDKEENLKNVTKKPPKPTKKSSFIKLFSRETNKKGKKEKDDPPQLVREESLRARYKEYRGNPYAVKENSNVRKFSDLEKEKNLTTSENYKSRSRLSTPSPSPPRDTSTLRHGKPTYGSWFKSLDRLSRKKIEKVETDSIKRTPKGSTSFPSSKSLRFFGDTDVETYESVQPKVSAKTHELQQQNSKNSTSTKNRSHSSRNLHNISEEFNNSDVDSLKKSHKSMQNISQSEWDTKDIKPHLKPPVSPNYRTSTLKYEKRTRKKRNELSSVESSTEGESSQQSQRSVVYLHAATVGDIPNPGFLYKNGKRIGSREELDLNDPSKLHTHTRTLSRSFSVLAPWKPRHPQERLNIDYSEDTAKLNSSGKANSSKNVVKPVSETSGSKTESDTRKSNQSLFTLSRKPKSKDNLSDTLNKKKMNENQNNGHSTLFKKRGKQNKENTRYIRDDKKNSSKSMSVESLSGTKTTPKKKKENKIVSRSVSMPRDPEKSAGWLKKDSKNKRVLSLQKL